jgi:hypothetical protein
VSQTKNIAHFIYKAPVAVNNGRSEDNFKAGSILILPSMFLLFQLKGDSKIISPCMRTAEVLEEGGIFPYFNSGAGALCYQF